MLLDVSDGPIAERAVRYVTEEAGVMPSAAGPAFVPTSYGNRHIRMFGAEESVELFKATRIGWY